MKIPSRNLLISAAVAAILHSQTSTGQEAAPFGEIEEVIVTAQKRAERIETVPLAITALTNTDIQSAGMLDIQDLAPFVPGLQDSTQNVDRNDRGFRAYFIRGVIASNPFSTRQTANIFVDGVLDFGGNIPNLTDVDHVEVVKGPQAAYFGRGTFGGAINFITTTPSLTEWKGHASVDAGSYDELTGAVSVEGPIIPDKFAVRIGARSYYTGGDYQDYGWPGNRLGQRSTKSLSLGMLFSPVDNLTIRSFNAYWTDDDGPPANGALFNNQYNCNGGAAPRGQLNYYCGPISGGMLNPATQTWSTYVYPYAYQTLLSGLGQPYSAPYLGPGYVNHIGLERHQWETRNQFEYKFDNNYTLSGNASFDSNKWGFLLSNSLVDPRNVPNPNYGVIPNVTSYIYNLTFGMPSDVDYNFEVRLVSPGTDRFNWQLGVNYFHDVSVAQTCAFSAIGYTGCVSPYEVFPTRDSAVFGSIHYSFTPTISVSVEGRWQSEYTAETDTPDLPLFNPGPPRSGSGTNSVFTPRVNLVYQPAERVSYYVSYAEGTLPDEFNTTLETLTAAQQAQIAQQATTHLLVPKELIKMEEIGAKGVYFDNKLQILAAAYLGQWTGRHITETVSYTGAGGLLSSIQVVAAGGIVDLHGVELEGTYAATDHLTLHLTADWAATNIRFTDSTDSLLLTGNPNPVGNQLPLYPAESGTFTVEYHRHAFGDFDGFTRLDYFFTGKIYDSEADLAWTAPASRVNLGIGISEERYIVELYGKNITDNLTPTGLQRNNFSVYNATGHVIASPNGIAYALADKAEFGVRVSAKFCQFW